MSGPAEPIAITEGLFRDGPVPTLIGGRERETGRVVFPCPVDTDRWDPVDLPRRGTLWSWTVQRFRPKTPPYIGPEEFEPFALGYVELSGATIVESRLVNVAFDSLSIGMPVELVVIPFIRDSRGRDVRIFGFAPVTEQQNA